MSLPTVNREECWMRCICGELYDRARGMGKHQHCENVAFRRPPTELERRRRRWQSKRKKTAPRIFKRDGHKCRHCGSTKKLTVDHIVPLVNGGSDNDSNLQTLCKSCNSKKGHQ